MSLFWAGHDDDDGWLWCVCHFHQISVPYQKLAFFCLLFIPHSARRGDKIRVQLQSNITQYAAPPFYFLLLFFFFLGDSTPFFSSLLTLGNLTRFCFKERNERCQCLNYNFLFFSAYVNRVVAYVADLPICFLRWKTKITRKYFHFFLFLTWLWNEISSLL